MKRKRRAKAVKAEAAGRADIYDTFRPPLSRDARRMRQVGRRMAKVMGQPKLGLQIVCFSKLDSCSRPSDSYTGCGLCVCVGQCCLDGPNVIMVEDCPIHHDKLLCACEK